MFLLVSTFVTIVLAGLFCWTLAVFKLAQGLPLVEWSPRRAVPWSLLDLIGLFGVYFVVSVIFGAALRGFGWLPEQVDLEKLVPRDQITLTVANMAISLGVLALALPAIALRSGATLKDLGWSQAELLADLRQGVIAFVMLAPPVYALQALLTQIWPSKHPLMEMFRDTPSGPFFALLFAAAVIVAPLAEELIFRVLLQGFLERLFQFPLPIHEWLLSTRAPGGPLAPMPGAGGDVVLAELAQPAASAAVTMDPHDPYAPPQVLPFLGASLPLAAYVPVTEPPGGVVAYGPIAISAVIFALLHWSHGPDWIPLIFLAAGMGYLYHRTHRLMPSLVVHTLLNALSMWGLWIQVYEMPSPP